MENVLKKKNCYRFNRQEIKLNGVLHHQYLNNFPPQSVGNHKFPGKIKCKMVHGIGYTLIIPELIICFDNQRYIQPLYFMAPVLCKNDTFVQCSICIDCSFGVKAKVEFNNTQLLKKNRDGSEIYECTISSVRDLIHYTTGKAKLTENMIKIQLFHHTKKEIVKLIEKDKSFIPSKWNLQGTKKLKEISYHYFTCIDKIKCKEDLQIIAMSHSGKMYFLIDNGNKSRKEDVLELNVYRESTKNRTESIGVFVDIDILSTPHIYKHYPNREAVYYEIVSPFIYRIAVLNNSRLHIKNNETVNNYEIYHNNYVVVGDCRSKEGLLAPYDEENTKEILKVEQSQEVECILSTWFKFQNLDLYSDKVANKMKFQETT